MRTWHYWALGWFVLANLADFFAAAGGQDAVLTPAFVILAIVSWIMAFITMAVNAID